MLILNRSQSSPPPKFVYSSLKMIRRHLAVLRSCPPHMSVTTSSQRVCSLTKVSSWRSYGQLCSPFLLKIRTVQGLILLPAVCMPSISRTLVHIRLTFSVQRSSNAVTAFKGSSMRGSTFKQCTCHQLDRFAAPQIPSVQFLGHLRQSTTCGSSSRLKRLGWSLSTTRWRVTSSSFALPRLIVCSPICVVCC